MSYPEDPPKQIGPVVERPYCGRCGGREQVVNTDAGPFCRHCYPAYKAGRMAPREVPIPPDLREVLKPMPMGQVGVIPADRTAKALRKKMSWEWNWPALCWDWPTFCIFNLDIGYTRKGDHSPGFGVLLMILGIKLLDFEYSNEYHFDDVDFDYDKFLGSVQAAQEAGVSPNVVVCEDERAAEALKLSIKVLDSPEYDVKKEIDTALAKALCVRLGYGELPDERIARIVGDVHQIQRERPSFSASLAFAHAVQMEIDMHGDPSYTGPEIKGFRSGDIASDKEPADDDSYRPENEWPMR